MSVAVEQSDSQQDASVGPVLIELAAFLDERIIPRLPVSCEWRWVVLRLSRAVARAGALPE